MTDRSQKFSGKPSGGKTKPPPQTTADNKRTFDARPKPSDVERRDPNTRPTRHVDRAQPDPLDPLKDEE